MVTHIIEFKDIHNLALAGGNNLSLGEMYNRLTSKRVFVPIDFTKNSDAFWEFLLENEIQSKFKSN
jgi:pyruvate,water dikinase